MLAPAILAEDSVGGVGDTKFSLPLSDRLDEDRRKTLVLRRSLLGSDWSRRWRRVPNRRRLMGEGDRGLSRAEGWSDTPVVSSNST